MGIRLAGWSHWARSVRWPRSARPASWPRGARQAVVMGAAVVLLAATAGVGYRVLAPAETLTAATDPYPAQAEQARSERYGNLAAAPLILDGRLRVYAEKRRVWADTPVTAKMLVTPFWAYRRWPAELVGLAGAEQLGQPPIVVSLWSDGGVVALDGTSGRIAWRTRVEPGGRYEGRRTGSRTVYEPAGLLTAASSTDSRPVVLVSRAGQVRAYDPWSGQQRWERRIGGDAGCHDEWTAPTAYLNLDTCARPPVLEITDVATGRRAGMLGRCPARPATSCGVPLSPVTRPQPTPPGSTWSTPTSGSPCSTSPPAPYARTSGFAASASTTSRPGGCGTRTSTTVS